MAVWATQWEVNIVVGNMATVTTWSSFKKLMTYFARFLRLFLIRQGHHGQHEVNKVEGTKKYDETEKDNVPGSINQYHLGKQSMWK